MRGPFPKISHTHPTMMKLGTVIPYLKMIQKVNKSRAIPLGVLERLSIFIQPIITFPATINLLDLNFGAGADTSSNQNC